jgi:hypothetical protein
VDHVDCGEAPELAEGVAVANAEVGEGAGGRGVEVGVLAAVGVAGGEEVGSGGRGYAGTGGVEGV